MNIGEEKKYIYEQMSEITLERRKLTDIYFSLKERLDELQKLEMRGLDDLSIKGYVDLHNKRTKEIPINNLKREMEHTVKKIEIETKPVVEEIVPKEEILKEKRKLKKKTGQVDYKKVSATIRSVLKEEGRPLQLRELYNKVIEQSGEHFTIENFTKNIIYRLVKEDGKVTKAMRGYYQYRA